MGMGDSDMNNVGSCSWLLKGHALLSVAVLSNKVSNRRLTANRGLSSRYLHTVSPAIQWDPRIRG